MDFHLSKPILVVGIGGVGSKLATTAQKSLNSNCVLISHQQQDFENESSGGDDSSSYSIMINTKPIVNPSVQLIRGCCLSKEHQHHKQLSDKISGHSSIVMITNLAGKAGAAIAPIVSKICKENHKKLISFAIMPFKFEKDKIFQAGISLKRLRDDSECTIVLDNDALLDCNPDLSPNECHNISNEAILNVIKSLTSPSSPSIPNDTNILSVSADEANDLEESLKNSLKMLYEDAPPNTVKRSIFYVFGGNNIPSGVLNSVSNIARGVFGNNSNFDEEDTNTRVDLATTSDENAKVVMLTAIQGKTRFDKYDPLGIIPAQKVLDWTEPDCSIDLGLGALELPQLE